jgi:hypothetical protein
MFLGRRIEIFELLGQHLMNRGIRDVSAALAIGQNETEDRRGGCRISRL